MTAAELAQRLDKARSSAGAWMGRCPAHEDRMASLSVKDGDSGGVVLKCHAGCDTEAILSALSLEWKDVFPEEPYRAAAHSQLVDSYVYKDAEGVPSYKVDRYYPKDFRQSHYELELDTWVPGLNGQQRLPFHLPELLEAKAKRMVFFCFSPDTEVLSRDHAWLPIAHVSAGDELAQFDPDGQVVEFAPAAATQSFDFDGEMVHLRSDFADLMVTPGHRMLARFPNCKERVVMSEDIRVGHYIPVAGTSLGGNSGPTPDEARFLAAWLGDGVDEKRGRRVSFNLKKARKVTRLRELLTILGIEFREHSHPSTPGWTRVSFLRDDADAMTWLDAPKLLGWDALNWSAAARGAFIDELRFWDGDGQSARIRFFTSKETEADIVSAMCAMTGYGVTKRVDVRKDRPSYRPAFVLNIVRRTWRSFQRPSVRVHYDGPVYCCTVPSGFLVVRRNGKVCIAGNCEGEKDVLTLERLGLIATTVAGGANAWKPELADYFRGARKVVVLPDNDEPGRKLGAAVGGDLSRLGVEVQVIDLPDLPEKGDVSDWVARGGTREALEAIVKGVAPGGLRIYSGESLRAVPSPKSKFVIGACVQEGLTILCGAPKTGKSLIAIEMANAVSRGSKALNFLHAEKGNALFFSLEDSLGMFRDRVGEMYGDFPEGLCVTRDKPGNILKNGWKNVEQAVKHIGNVRLVVVDTLACIHEGANGRGSVYHQDADFGHAVHNWAMANNLGLILIHHDRKMKAEASGDPIDDISGSKGLTGAAVGIMMFRRQRFEDTGRLQVIGKTMADREYEVTRTQTNRWVVFNQPEQEDAIRASVQKPLV